MSKKCRAFSKSKLGLEQPNNRKAFYAGWDVALREALAQPEQEPVAWLQIGLAPLHEGDVIARTTKPTKWNPEWWRFEPLYTTPPQRKPLSDDEIYDMYNEPRSDAEMIAFARAIEAAHGIKGEA